MVERAGGESHVQVAGRVPRDAREVLAGDLLGVAARVHAARVRAQRGVEVRALGPGRGGRRSRGDLALGDRDARRAARSPLVAVWAMYTLPVAGSTTWLPEIPSLSVTQSIRPAPGQSRQRRARVDHRGEVVPSCEIVSTSWLPPGQPSCRPRRSPGRGSGCRRPSCRCRRTTSGRRACSARRRSWSTRWRPRRCSCCWRCSSGPGGRRSRARCPGRGTGRCRRRPTQVAGLPGPTIPGTNW